MSDDKQRRTLRRELKIRTLLGAVVTLVVFLVIFVALDWFEYLDPATVFGIIAAGLIIDKLVAVFITPRLGGSE